MRNRVSGKHKLAGHGGKDSVCRDDEENIPNRSKGGKSRVYLYSKHKMRQEVKDVHMWMN